MYALIVLRENTDADESCDVMIGDNQYSITRSIASHDCETILVEQAIAERQNPKHRAIIFTVGAVLELNKAINDEVTA